MAVRVQTILHITCFVLIWRSKNERKKLFGTPTVFILAKLGVVKSKIRSLKIEGFIQYGARSSHRCLEVIFIIRFWIENCHEWNMGCVIVSIDLERAFENIELSKVLEHCENQNIPPKLRYVLFKELAGQKFVRYLLGPNKSNYLPKQKE